MSAARIFREEEHELIQACRDGHGTMYDQDDLADVVAGLAIECENREAALRAIEAVAKEAFENAEGYMAALGKSEYIARAALTPEESKP